MSSAFSLKSTLGRSYNVDLDDTLRTKKALRSLGHYQTPSYGITEYPDEQLFDGIKGFQKEQGLRQDGVMKPDGETATKLGSVMQQKAQKPKEKQSQPTGWAAVKLAQDDTRNAERNSNPQVKRNVSTWVTNTPRIDQQNAGRASVSGDQLKPATTKILSAAAEKLTPARPPEKNTTSPADQTSGTEVAAIP